MHRTRTLPLFIRLGVGLGILLLSACTTDPEPAPVIKGDPELVHTGVNLVLIPSEATEESLYVKNAEPGKWALTLLAAPPGTKLANGKITYSIPAGLNGPLEVHAIATDGKGDLLDLVWSVTATPNPNLPPAVRFQNVPQWIVAGKTFRLVVNISDPEGDSMTFYNRFPVGAVYHDSVLEWTPSAEQIGRFEFVFDVYDKGRHHAADGFYINVKRYDPKPFTADISVGRRWWIRGHSFLRFQGKPDSSYVHREVRITSSDSATGVFRFHIIDTISSNGKDSIEESEFSGSSREGFGFNSQANPTEPINVRFPESLPFDWPTDNPVFQNTTYEIQGKTYPALRQISAKACDAKYNCSSHESFNVPGLGRVSVKAEYEQLYRGYSDSHAFEVWSVAGP